MSEFIPILYLSLVSFFAWIVSTLAGGGSPFILIPLVNLLMGTAAVPPVITIGMFLGNAHRVLLFWREIDWKLTAWYAPGAIVGAFLGAYTFTQVQIDWLQLLIGVFLVVSAVLFILEKKSPKITEKSNPIEGQIPKSEQTLPILNPDTANAESSSSQNAIAQPESQSKSQSKSQFKLQAWHILPAGFFKAYVSGLVGTTGPVLNPFYLSYGLIKEQLLATKATHVTIIHLVKIITYGALDALSREQVIAGLAIGLAAVPANLVGKYILSRMSPDQFRQVVLTFMLIGGLWMFWEQRILFANLFDLKAIF